ncbi:isopentenyl-diphosphate Delta-isomerase [Nocardioides mesophilus]|uniref:Isopentenyl-diphosphate Delta-isomerase n=1 Tax=Nocardioides mesophilus TaxID=433659 RepID=A0A7G9RCZ6_9ACTN|nr:isopentenyl-diphosphate Delta-isomerase [Nocardioides mesophilus]QNN53471.1 isopentenyl-diphosphate Delta-isomerase [Nocardioides mesophilus]
MTTTDSTSPAPSGVEEVVLLDEAGHRVGTAAKADVHHRDTPLHLAFSCYVFDSAGRLLLSRRALDKATFPGVWSNSFCGHPAPDEDVRDALHRRARQELGIGLRDLEPALPRFRYVAAMRNGVRENELCPVFTALTADDVRPDATEVADTEWVPWAAFRDEVLAGVRDVSSWCIEQVTELARREVGPGRFATAGWTELPPAMRPRPRP